MYWQVKTKPRSEMKAGCKNNQKISRFKSLITYLAQGKDLILRLLQKALRKIEGLQSATQQLA